VRNCVVVAEWMRIDEDKGYLGLHPIMKGFCIYFISFNLDLTYNVESRGKRTLHFRKEQVKMH
jgi:hypothetical protein